jgi:hypothetical protein
MAVSIPAVPHSERKRGRHAPSPMSITPSVTIRAPDSLKVVVVPDRISGI